MSTIHELIQDARLLVVLDVLLEERSATRAAARLGVTQSSVSHSLRRLRSLLDDELFVRSGRRLVPTPRAQALQGPLRRLLGELGGLLRGDSQFDPTTSSRQLVMTASDLFTSSVLPVIMRLLADRAPRMNVRIHGTGPGMFEALEHGGVDLLFGGPTMLPRGFHRRELFRDDFTCLVRSDHPRVRRKLDLDRYVAERHVLVTPTGRPGSQVDDRLAQVGRRRDIALMLPHFLAAGRVVAATDLMTTLPTRIAVPLARNFGLRRLRPPLSDLGYTIHALWHGRVSDDPAVRWLLDVAAEASKKAP